MTTWKKIKPKSTKSRKSMKKKYGNSCFLDAKNLKYPICNKYTGKQECKGLRAAEYYLNINIGKIIKRKLKTKKKQLKQYFRLKRKSSKLVKKLCF